ncbi:MAG: type II toxin-antitoxin system Phd/YefM family antitoxin, partial [Azoarcus sp.]|jgi:hypothetical protein|nr:type II toxin-antitoxin system Phd/YefM family antitoxin [Azoarcus sp.]
VVITKNKRPVGIMLSMEDAAQTLIPDVFFDKEEGYDEWFKETVEDSLQALREGREKLYDHDEVVASLAERFRKSGVRS